MERETTDRKQLKDKLCGLEIRVYQRQAIEWADTLRKTS